MTKAVLVRVPYPGTSKHGVRVVSGFEDDLAAYVFASQVAKKPNVLLDGDREYRHGEVMTAEVVTIEDELHARGVKQADYEAAVASRRDKIAERAELEREQAEKREAERCEKQRQEEIDRRALELAEKERAEARERLYEKAAADVDGLATLA